MSSHIVYTIHTYICVFILVSCPKIMVWCSIMYRKLLIVHMWHTFKWNCMFYAIMWSMLPMMNIICLNGWLMQACGIGNFYFINSHKKLIIILLLDHELYHVVLLNCYIYFIRIVGIVLVKLGIRLLTCWLIFDLNKSTNKY